jgi:hypothetical protein
MDLPSQKPETCCKNPLRFAACDGSSREYFIVHHFQRNCFEFFGCPDKECSVAKTALSEGRSHGWTDKRLPTRRL